MCFILVYVDSVGLLASSLEQEWRSLQPGSQSVGLGEATEAQKTLTSRKKSSSWYICNTTKEHHTWGEGKNGDWGLPPQYQSPGSHTGGAEGHRETASVTTEGGGGS